MGLEYYPQKLLAKGAGSSWKEYEIVQLRCHIAPNNSEGIFIQTGHMVEEGITVSISPRFKEEFRRFFWDEDGPLFPTFNFTFTLHEDALIPNGIVSGGEFYSFVM